ncbi:hypothetical protein R0381_002560 [Jeongeupia wiesaeckerbachi]|uniref:hypothetical protein n=1 Tax=Jeongeupia wiesaeckerbachi TaxID=3051218 RepID=UPI003D803492
MDYPKSVPGVGLKNGKFTDGNPLTGEVASLDPASWANGVTDELLAVISDSGLTPSESIQTQLRDALRNKYADLTRTGTAGAINFRNKLINGNFDFWQRGTTYNYTSGISTHCADRWYLANIGTFGASTGLSRMALTPDEIPGASYALYWKRVAPVADTISYEIGQRIEGVRTLAGKTITLSFWYKNDVGSAPPFVSFSQIFGTGGSPSTIVSTSSQVIPASSTWTKVVMQFALPSIAGKTLGTNGDDFLVLKIVGPKDVAGGYYLSQVQLEEGLVATPFEQRPMQIELTLCQRYYRTSYELGVRPGSISVNRGSPNSLVSSGNPVWVPTCISFSPLMRAAPAVTIYQPSTGAAGVIEETGEQNARAVQSVESSASGIGLLILSSAAASPSLSMQWHYVADAEL